MLGGVADMLTVDAEGAIAGDLTDAVTMNVYLHNDLFILLRNG